MKKLMIAALLIFASSAAFAGDSDALKAILKAKTYTEAEGLLKSNLAQLTTAAEKANWDKATASFDFGEWKELMLEK